ncbi:rubrerythrin family protein [Natronorubrum sp. FCH18a]|uniref:rubrerythrin family protein n=1 Tax=Natronorubrum sp. FCH18a TaxID=3447018 RepID=UPI003F5154D3
MDAAEFQDSVEESLSDELERLGSSKLLVALTDADLTEESVLRTVANSERAAMETFESWADDEEHTDAQDAFAEFCEQEREHYDRVVAFLDGEYEADADASELHDRLRSLETTAARLGGLVGRSLVGERTHLQVVSFFVNEGDERRADVFRELRTETAAQGDRALEVLEGLCDGPEDWNRARTAAEDAIGVAYETYAESLDDLGLDPKPIC